MVVTALLTVFVVMRYSRYDNSRLQKIAAKGDGPGTRTLWVLPVALGVWIGLRPISSYFVDMVNYDLFYKVFALGHDYTFRWDTENVVFDNLFYWMGSHEWAVGVFFLTVSCVYFLGTFAALRRMFPYDTTFAYVAFLGAFSTFSYGTNGIKAGMAAAVFLLALAYWGRPVWCIVLLLLSIGCHHSMIVPVAAFGAAWLVPRPRWAAALWVLCMVLALAHVTYFQEIFSSNASEHANEYLKFDDTAWGGKSGFRWDFVLYSAVPVVTAFMALARGYRSRFFNTVFTTYLITNAVWMLCMYVPFNNRIAYLSWLLYPVILVYPYLDRPFMRHQYRMAGALLVLQLLFLLAMEFGYYA